MTAPAGGRWQAIHAELLRRIQAGDWAPGAAIPGEVDLAAEFGVARATVSRALGALAEAGLVERRRRAGSRVARAPVRRATLDIPIIRRDIEGRGAAYAHVLLEQARAPAPVAVLGRLGLPAGSGLLHLRAVHLADGVPHAYEDRWVNTDAVPGLLAVDLAAVSANEWLVTHVPWSHGDFAVEAVAADAADGRALDLRAGAALLVVRRSTWAEGVPVTHVRLAYAPGHVLRMSL